MQLVLTLIAVTLCAAYLLRAAMRAVRGRPGALGNCCSTGCQPTMPKPQILPGNALAARAADLAARRAAHAK